MCRGCLLHLKASSGRYRAANAKGRSASAEVQLRSWSCSQRLPCHARNRRSGSACERALDPAVVAAAAGWEVGSVGAGAAHRASLEGAEGMALGELEEGDSSSWRTDRSAFWTLDCLLVRKREGHARAMLALGR